MKTITRHLRLIKMFFSFRMSNQMIYRASFWTAFFVDVSLFLIHLAVFQTLFFNVDSINGWSKYQMVFFVGTFTLIDGLEMWLYFFGVTSIPMKIREGKLDIYLTKPVNTLFWLTFENMDISFSTIAWVALGAYLGWYPKLSGMSSWWWLPIHLSNSE